MEVNQSKLYDRQIQIFGADTQKTISASEVLVSGLSTVASEVVKNMALIGFNIALHDPKPMTTNHIALNPLLGVCDESDCGKPLDQVIAEKLRDMNPCVSIRVVTGPLANAFRNNTKIFVSGVQSYEHQHALSSELKHITLPKFYIFQVNYRFLAIAETTNTSFQLSELSQDQLRDKLADQDLKFDFSESHTPSLNDFVLHCVFGATLNQSLLGMISSGRVSHNVLYLDVNSDAENPSQHRRLESLLLN